MASVQQTLAEAASTQATSNGAPTKSFVRPGKSAFSDSPDARSKTMIHLDGPNTYGLLNHIPSTHTSFTIGVSEDKGARRTMEDAHSFVIDFAGIKGQGYFAVFDGHAGKHAAEWCGQHFHEYLLDGLATGGDTLIPDVLAKTFLRVDKELSRMSDDGTTHSGCTAATCFLRLESSDGKQPFAPPFETLHPPSSSAISISSSSSDKEKGSESPRSGTSSNFTRKIKDKFSGNKKTAIQDGPALASAPVERGPPAIEVEAAKRVLYTANVGDARAVLSRSGKAIRLTYDHKGSDKTEIKRIIDAGGFVMNNRVNGVLAVTRSLGDSAMKEFVVGSPYTTETEIVDDDEYVVIACDGLWDVCEDQQAVDLIRNCKTAQEASDLLLKHALSNFSNDNVSVIVIKFGSGSNVVESGSSSSC